MTQPFDHSRFDWYPNSLGGPAVVANSNGTPRPPLRTPLRNFTVHYGGAGTNWLDLGDTAAELRGIELNHARPQGKPNEYNSASDSAAETWEYAGRFLAAHSGSPWNSTDWGHLAVYGLEVLSEADATNLIRGIRRARAQCVRAGYITADHAVHPHAARRRTSCPGPLWTNKAWWNRIVAPLTPVDFDQIAPTLPPPTPGGHSVFLKLIRLDGAPAVYAQYSGGYKTWIPDEATLGVFASLSGRGVEVVSSRPLFRSTGPILGPVPPGVDAWGIPAA